MNPLARFSPGELQAVLAAERQDLFATLTESLQRAPTNSELLDAALMRSIAMRELGSSGFVRRFPARPSKLNLDDGPALGATRRELGR